jgi:hypothetical protein
MSLYLNTTAGTLNQYSLCMVSFILLRLHSLYILPELTMFVVINFERFFFRGSKITRMLQESIGNPSCRTTMMAHVSPSLPFYSETLGIAQLASRLHRLRKRKGKVKGIQIFLFKSNVCVLRYRKA